jgi:hypothetical protein
VNQDLEDNLLRTYKRSQHWGELSFRNLRENQLLQFTGDAALYISRYAGRRVVDRLLSQATDPQQGIKPNSGSQDHLHLVTHSWGTVIFFDVLFSGRWDQVGSYQGVNEIRRAIFGLDPAPGRGLRLSSIHTMGSPISVFSLFISTDNPLHPVPCDNGRKRISVPNTHDITPGLKDWLRRIDYSIPWYNYLHAEDLIAYPLEDLIPDMLENPDFDVRQKLKVKDIIIASPPRLWNVIAGMSDLLQAGQIVTCGVKAHQSYWTEPQVAQRIFHTISETMPRPPISPVEAISK